MIAGRRAAAVTIATAVLLLVLVPAEVDAGELPGPFLRLHVVANSNAAEDQALKYEVRDRVLDYLRPHLEGAGDFVEARRMAISHKDEVAEVARGAVRDAGFDSGVQVSLRYTRFPARTYGAVEVAEGWYWALTLTIGRGEGENWWCVLFPVLCIGPSEEDEAHLEPSSMREGPRFRSALFMVLSEMIRRSDGEQYSRSNDGPTPVQKESEPPLFWHPDIPLQ